jgi:HemY protein
MVRFLLYLTLLGLAVAGAVWLADRPGGVVVDWQDWRIETSVPVLLAAVLAFALLLALALGVLRFLGRAPSILARARRERRQRKGYQALTQGLVAVASGDSAQARGLAKRAQALLENPPLTRLLMVQAAQLDRDEPEVERQLEAMLETPETAPLALRGLIRQAGERGDLAAALGHARRAYELRPGADWAVEALFDLLVKTANWAEAHALLEKAAKRGVVERETARHRRAALLVELARASASADHARALFEKAHELARDLTPAALGAARKFGEMEKIGKAERVLERAWAAQPHPDLAAAYRALKPAEDPVRQVLRLEKLVAARPDHPQSRLVLAEASLMARLWGPARGHLAPLVEDSPTLQACRLMAAITEGEGQAAQARLWLDRALAAPPDPAWLCRSCGAAGAEWRAVCPRCGGFDSFVFDTPYRALTPLAAPSAPQALPAS